MRGANLASWAEQLPEQIARVYQDCRHGDLARWLAALDALPEVLTQRVDLASACISAEGPVSEAERARIHESLMQLHPWRKGPFSIHGVTIDAEWRSDLKWQRISRVMTPLRGRRVLDVGCGNGYYAWRMLGAGADLVIGVDPSLRFVAQYQALRRFLGDHPAYVLPLSLEQVPDSLRTFDSVFSMGVFYHRRSPLDHLLKLKDCLRPGGELVLETLVVEGDANTVLAPPGRYAQMRNVWFLPSAQALLSWVRRCGFRQAQVADISLTTSQEQRSTPWMRFQSLSDFLDPEQPGLTIEGLPAPQRCIVTAHV
jgi:tRNA (mo5U34)-methyltransferase